MRAVVLAGGKGTRLAPYTRIFPKPLMPIGDKPILEIMLRQMKRAGIRHVTLTVGYLGDMMRLFFQDGSRLGMEIDYAEESKPLGTSGPLANVEGLNDTFLVTNGDVLTDLDLTPDEPLKNRCGKCRVCANACPAQAIRGVGTKTHYDSREEALFFDRCRTKVLDEFAKLPHITGGICGVCVAACPYGRKAGSQGAKEQR